MQKLLKNRGKIFLFLSSLIFIVLILLSSNGKVSPLNEEYGKKLVSKELSKKDYQKIRDKYINLLNLQNPRVALQQLREDIKTDDSLLRSCHILTHEIGHQAYKNYQDFAKAMSYQDGLCNSGYMHGIIEEYLATSKDIFTSLKSVCSQYRGESLIGWECFHAVGHGLMYYTANDLPASLKLCESFDSQSTILACVNGVFMENFAADQKLHPSRFLKSDDYFYPCSEQRQDYKADCYVYAPTRYLSVHKNAYSEALNWCNRAEREYQTICAQGVGSQMIKENINNPLLAEEICMGAEKDLIRFCIEGIVNLYVVHFGSLDSAKKLCIKFEASNRDVCEKTVQARSSLFQN